MPDISEILARAKRREAKVPVCLAGDLAGELDQLHEQLRDAGEDWEPTSLADVAPHGPVLARIDEVREQMRAHTVTFHLRALGHTGFADLIAAHPATDPKAPVPYDAGTFLPALLAGCSVEPVMTIDQVRELIDVLNDGDVRQLYGAALAVNEEANPLPF